MPTGVYDHSSRRGLKCSNETIDKIKLARARQVGDKSSNWKGGIILRSGYRYIKVYNHPLSGKQGYYAEHRLVMEKHIGRYLTKQEVVHHINHDILDNRLENLQLFATHGEHTKFAHPEVRENQRILFKGKHFSLKTEFSKGMIPWNKAFKSS